MFLEIIVAVLFGWLVFSYYSDSNLDDISSWFKKLIKNFTYHDISYDDEFEDNQQILNTNNDESQKKVETNQYDELLSLALETENNEIPKNEETSPKIIDEIRPSPERDFRNDDSNKNSVPILKDNSLNNIPIDTNNENNSVINSNEVNELPSYTAASSSLEGASLY